MDEILYGKPLNPRVKEAVPCSDFKLLLTFSNGEKRMFDFAPMLQYPVFKPLQSPSFFQTVAVAHGTVCWAGDIDYCPDCLYEESKPIE